MKDSNIQIFDSEYIGLETDSAFMESALSCVGNEEKVNIIGANFIFLGDEELRNVNKQYLDRDDYTDVISFNLSEDENVEGEVYLSYDRVKENSDFYDVSAEQELIRVMVHGLLHLIGYQDKTEAEKNQMTEKEDHYLSKCLKYKNGKDNR